MLCYDDNCNTGRRFWECLLSLGLNAIMFKGVPHLFGYPNQAPIHPSLCVMPIDTRPMIIQAYGMDDLIRNSKVVHFLASTFVAPRNSRIYQDCKIVVQHGGSTYRAWPERSNLIFNRIADATIIQCPDLLGYGAKNEHLIFYPVDTDYITPNFERKDQDKLIIGHFPSNRDVKGTATIVPVIDALLERHPDKFIYIGARPEIPKQVVMLGNNVHKVAQDIVSWDDNLKRIQSCDIVIETLNPEIGGKKYGAWGNTALEAAASGVIPVSNDLYSEVYFDQYGYAPAMFKANTGEDLYKLLEGLIGSENDHIRALKEATRKWAVKYHSIKATADRLWDRVYKDFFPEMQ